MGRTSLKLKIDRAASDLPYPEEIHNEDDTFLGLSSIDRRIAIVTTHIFTIVGNVRSPTPWFLVHQ